MKKLILWIILFAVILAAVGGIAAASDGFKVLNPKDWKIFNKNAENSENTDILAFADEWELTAGTDESALKINQDTKSIFIDDLALPGAGGVVSEFICKSNTYAERIRIFLDGNKSIWNASGKSMEFHGDITARTFDFHNYELYKNMFAEYYNANQSNIETGACVGTMTIEIDFVFPEKLKFAEYAIKNNIEIVTDFFTYSDYVYYANIPIFKA